MTDPLSRPIAFSRPAAEKIAAIVRAAESSADQLVPDLTRSGNSPTGVLPCVRMSVTDRLLDANQMPTSLLACQVLTAAGGSASADGETYVVATTQIHDIGEVINVGPVENLTGQSCPVAASGGLGTFDGQIVWQALFDGPNVGYVVCQGPNGEGDFADARYWVQVCSTQNQPVTDEPGLVPMQPGSPAVPIIVAVTNLAELGCQSHLALPGTVVMLSGIREQSKAASGSSSGSGSAALDAPGPVQWVTSYVDQTKCNRNPCIPPSSSSGSSSGSSSSGSGCGGDAGCINNIGQTLQSGGVTFSGMAPNMGFSVTVPAGFDAEYGIGGQTTDPSGNGFFTIRWNSGAPGQYQATVVFSNGQNCIYSFETGCNNSSGSGTGSTGSGSGSCNCEWEYVTVVTGITCLNGALQVSTSTVKVLV